MINKTQTKKLNKALEANGIFDTRRYVGKSGAGYWYVGLVNKDVAGFPDNMFTDAQKAIDAAVDGFWPEEIFIVSRD